MDQRTRFLEAMRRRRSGYVPLDLQLSPFQMQVLKEKTGYAEAEDYCDAPFQRVRARYIGDASVFHPYHRPEDLPLMHITCWGVGLKRGSLYHFTEKVHSMTHLGTLAEFERYPLPDPDRDFDWEALRRDADTVHAKGCVACVDYAQTIFEMAWQMRGMDALLMDMMTEPELALCLFSRMATVRTVMVERALDAGCEMLLLGDDVATQRGMLMRPSLWRDMLKPFMRDIIAAARQRRPDVLIGYHGCGDMSALLDDIVEMGVDLLNPVQPECMDPVRIKARYGDCLSLWGLIGTQSLLPFGTPRQVYDACMHWMRTLSGNGGLMLAPAHVVEPEVPWDNVEAAVRAVQDFNLAQ
ncbi:MAG TPA: uroporphyrinogen decarboxylase family protein [Clostridia bacterium]|nr:uroporphyrinogen decarboxylase family protein [Clostridia bacterium]